MHSGVATQGLCSLGVCTDPSRDLLAIYLVLVYPTKRVHRPAVTVPQWDVTICFPPSVVL